MSIKLPSFGSDVIRIVQSSTLRKEECAKRLRYYMDDQSQDTMALIARRWQRPEQFRVFTVNAVRSITNRRANSYRIQPRRTFSGMDQNVGDQLYKAANVDAVLKKASRYVKLCKTAMLQVGWNEERGVPTLDVITPNILDVAYRDPQYPDRVIVTYPHERHELVTYAEWTPTSFRLLNHRGASLRIDGNPGNENPFGIVPMVPLFDRLPDDRFFLHGGADLIEAQEAINVALANLWRAVELQAHGQAWASGLSANEVLQFGPDRTVALPANGQFGFAAPNSPIAAILDAIEFVLRQTAATHGVSSDVFDLSKSAVSGSAQEASRVDLREERLDDIALWRVQEARLFDVLRTVVNTYQPGTIPDDATVSVNFADLEDTLSEADQLANAQTKIALGVWSPVDVLMATQPDQFSDRQSAYAELQRRRDEAAELALPL